MIRVESRGVDGRERTDHADFFDAVKEFAQLTGQDVRDVREAWHRTEGNTLTWDGGDGEYYVDLICDRC